MNQVLVLRGDILYIPLKVVTDYSLLKSMIKIDDLIKFLKEHNLKTCAICDENMFGAIEFYRKCLNNNIKPILGLQVKFNNFYFCLYAKNYAGYQNLLLLNTLMQEKELVLEDLVLYKDNVIAVIELKQATYYAKFKDIYPDVYIAYTSEYEKNNALITTSNILFAPKILALKLEDVNYLKYLDMISNNENIDFYQSRDYSKNYYFEVSEEEDIKTTYDFSNLCNVEIPYNKRYIPKYDVNINSLDYLKALALKGLLKRLNNQKDDKYIKRLNYELTVIEQMGFVDYFLIVYDYVLYAKKHDILVGPGRGSAAGSLVAYALGIIDIDPLKYNLLFERFLNKERITMPDIDIDFQDNKREEVFEYLRHRYDLDKVAHIMTYATLGSKQVIRDVARVLNIDEDRMYKVTKYIDAKKNLLFNYQNNQELQTVLKYDQKLGQMYQIAMKLEGLKRQISTHASGVVVSSKPLDNIIAMVKNNDTYLTGCTMEYLEDLGLIKMDLLAIKNLRIIKDILNLIKTSTGQDLKLADIPLDDEMTLELFARGATDGVFQFESEGMKSFLKKLKPKCFEDLIAAIALYRPGPMDNIDEFIKRKEKKVTTLYLHEDLKDILENTYGIIVYQEQIMQILVKMGGYSYAQADNIRRAMSKKKVDVMQQERQIFIKSAMQNGYSESVAVKVYDLIVKFANYGFNKSHSVAYALVGYQMAYLKAHYNLLYYVNLLNMSIASEVKTNEYLHILKQNNVKIYSPNINLSKRTYVIKNNSILLPLTVVKNVSSNQAEAIIEERKQGVYQDLFDFVKRTIKHGVNQKTIESLIYVDALRDFKLNKKTLITNLESAYTYAELTSQIASPLILKPKIEEVSEYNVGQLISYEKENLGFYISNHPTGKYHLDNAIKLNCVNSYFDKFVKCIVYVTRITNINTKKGDKMSFVTAEDESASLDFVVFPAKISLMTKFKEKDIILVSGKVEKRIDKYQIVVSNIEKIN